MEVVESEHVSVRPMICVDTNMSISEFVVRSILRII